MHLKTLKISGFKSFKDPINLEFSKGISAIVGPNGSGKSNITDAIKWVLGEQSIKSLRGKKMEDVIFSGTQKWPPSAYAEVVLVLDNRDRELNQFTDYIEVARKLYRSGESDYRINKKSCKLREIQSVFMDTGLGKNGYSLISQGGIEKIVASSPNELRAQFEEAVGIVSYKNKKNDAEKKLDSTKDHMDRLQDILKEIRKQMDPLKKQSQKARKYQKFQEELKILDIVLFHDQVNDSIQRLQALKSKLQNQKTVCEKNDALINDIDKKYQVLTIENRHLSTLIEKNRQARNEVKTKLEVIQTENSHRHSQREANRMTQERLQSEEKMIQAEALKNQNLMDEHVKEAEAFRKKLKIIGAEQKSKKTALEKLRGEESRERSRLKQFKEEAINDQKRKEGLIENRFQIRSEIQNVSTQLESLKQEIHEKRKQIINGDSRLESLKEEIKTLAEEKKALSAEKEANQYAETELKVRALSEKIQLESNAISINQSKIEYLKNIQANYQDYFPAIQKIMNSERDLGSAQKEVYGPVGELFTTQKRYLRAIDVALGGKSQNIVVSKVGIARQCINLLKKERLGRATFLPLDNLRNTPIDQKTLQKIRALEGVEGLAADLVETRPEFLKCAQNLLGRVIVADRFENAKNAQQASNGRLTVVTLEGEIFYPGGAILGGESKKNKESPLSKKIEITKLQESIKIKNENLKQLLAADKKMKHLLSEQKEALIRISEKIKTVERFHWEKEEQFKNLKIQVNDWNQQIKALEEDEKQALLQKKRLVNEQVALGVDEKKEDDKQSSEEDQLERLRENIEVNRRALQDIEEDQTKTEAEIRSLEKQQAFVALHVQEKKDRLGEINKKFNDYQNQNEKLLKEEKEFVVESSALKNKIEEFNQKSKNNQVRFNKNNEQLSILQERIRTENHALIINNDLKNKILSEQKELELSVEHLDKKMFENYGMNQLMAEDAYKKYQQDNCFSDLEISEKRQAELKNKMGQLGSININAIESYEALQIRHDHLEDQLKDLSLGKTALYKIISELHEAISNQFKRNFIKLQESFSRIFATLFEGGQAYLEFTNPQGILEGGIELVAQPPGKKLRQLSLLSGGEKSMVAIALLFSFLEINPSPFCVIDEVDAALDEQNIFRYIKYLKKAAQNNQFITITHRRRTLEVCEHLYGVSMSNDGISQLVSVRLMDYA